MLRPTALLLTLLIAAGCRSPMPTFDPMLVHGARTVPPPATGSYGKPDPYYQGSAAPGVNNASGQLSARSGLTLATSSSQPVGTGMRVSTAAPTDAGATQLQWGAGGNAGVAPHAPPQLISSGVVQASHMQSPASPPPAAVIRPVAPASRSLTLDRMPVNDATYGYQSPELPASQRLLQLPQMVNPQNQSVFPQPQLIVPSYQQQPNMLPVNTPAGAQIYHQGAILNPIQAVPARATTTVQLDDSQWKVKR